MSVESTTQALCDLALRFGEGDEESMVSWQFYSSFLCHWLSYTSLFYPVVLLYCRQKITCRHAAH